MQGYFVTGTGTGVGKTYVATRLLRYWQTQRIESRAYKPVESGINGKRPEETDAGQLLLALGRQVNMQTLEGISPWRFRQPLSPDIAAQREGVPLDMREVAYFCHRQLGGRADYTLIEGAGGIMTPIDALNTNLDLIDELDLPVILVAGSYLGSISHTLTALAAIAQRGIEIKALVVNASEEAPLPIADHVAMLRSHGGTLPICTLSHGAKKSEVAMLSTLIGAVRPQIKKQA